MSTEPAAIDFAMHGARAAMAGGLSHIEEQVRGIERAVIENPGLAFDLAKTIVESTCRTILTERRITFEPADGLSRIFETVTTHLPMLPISASSEAEARKTLAQTLNGLHTELQGVCELRNAYGFASHGSDGPRPAMESGQALLAAQAADTIVGFLYRVHVQGRTFTANMRLEYRDNEAFNDFIDEANTQVRIFELLYRPSEVLFAVDREAYRERLDEYAPAKAEGDVESGEASVEGLP